MRATCPALPTLTSLLTIASASAVQDIDTAVPCADGNPAVYLCAGEHADCAVDFAGDLDRFEFFGRAGDRMQVVVHGLSNDLDPNIRIGHASGTPVDLSGTTSSCSVNQFGRCGFTAEFVLPLDGAYILLLDEIGNTNTGTYSIHLEKTLPDYPVPSLDYGASPVPVMLAHRGDIDWVRFEGDAGTDVRIAVNGLSNDLDPTTHLFLPDGSLMQTDSCSVNQFGRCNYVVDLVSLPQTGTYWIQVEDDDGFNLGSIDLSLQCTGFLPCPPASIDGPLGTSYCSANANSTGSPATISAFGSEEIAADRLYLTAQSVPAGTFGIFFTGMVQAGGTPLPPPSQGNLCVDNPLFRMRVVQACANGDLRGRLFMDDLPPGMSVASGQTWNFQAWFRDGTASNTSDGVSVTLQ